MNKPTKISLSLTTIALISTLFIDILFMNAAREYLASGYVLKYQYQMLGYSALIQYILRPVMIISFLIAAISASMYAKKGWEITNFHKAAIAFPIISLIFDFFYLKFLVVIGF